MCSGLSAHHDQRLHSNCLYPHCPPPLQDKTPDFVRRWIRQHAADAALLGKPLLLEEFGKWGSGAQRAERDQYMKLIYDEVAAVSGPAWGGGGIARERMLPAGGGPLHSAAWWAWPLACLSGRCSCSSSSEWGMG